MGERKKPGNKVDEYLKSNVDIKNPLEEPKDATFSQEKHKEYLKKKLLEDPKDMRHVRQEWKGRFHSFRETLFRRLSYFQSKKFRRWMHEYMPFALFFGLSTIILWKMEAQMDKMKNKVTAAKSFKELEIEKENQLIRRQLAEEGESTPLTEIDETMRYKFEEDSDEDEAESEEEDILVEEDEHEKFLQSALKGAGQMSKDRASREKELSRLLGRKDSR